MNHVIRRDLKLSYLVAPFRVLVPIIGYLTIYPLILNNYGSSVLGMWALLAAIPQALTSIDFGFSLILTREAGSRSGEELVRVFRKYRAAQKVFHVIGPFIVGIAIVFSLVLNEQAYEYHRFGIRASVVIMAVAVILQRLAALDLAVLNGFSDNYFVHLVGAWAPIVFFGIGLAGIVLGYPLESLSLGFLGSVVAGWLAFRMRLARNHTRWVKVGRTRGERTSFHEVKSLVKDGLYLYLASLGMVLRDPALRFTIGLLLGLEAVGVYEIAMRVGRTGRDIISSGFSTLYSSFSILIRNNEFREMEIITKRSILLLSIIGGGLLGTIFLLAPSLLNVWLGEIGETMIVPTRIVCTWAAITLFNTPFWYQLMAGGTEKDAARAVWVHTVSVFALFPAALWVGLTLNGILIYWLIGSIATQLYLYVQAEKRFHLVVATFRTPHIAVAISVLIATVVLLNQLVYDYGLPSSLSICLFYAVIFAIVLVNRNYLMFWFSAKSGQAAH